MRIQRAIQCGGRAAMMGLAAFMALMLSAHEGPEHEIEELTQRIAANGESADLLLERAIEYRVLGQLKEAMSDLERASKLEPGLALLQRELGRVQFTLGKTNDAMSTVNRAIKLPEIEPQERASLYILRAEFYQTRKEYPKALADCTEAIRLHPANADWYLQRSAVHKALDQPKERLAGIDEGIRETGAGVLDIERVEALLDSKQWNEALAKIEVELEASRLKASWLIRRARARTGLERKEDATADLKAALAEISDRMVPGSKDVSLLVDRAVTHELLGEKEEALNYYNSAQDAGAEEWVKAKIKTLKSQISKDDPDKDKEKDKDKDKED